jgi:hypothetical protein
MLDHEVAIEAANAGMYAIVLKSHEGSTVERAKIAQAVAGNKVNVFGGIALNSFVGGLNPIAVRAAIKMGAKIIWMPTFTAKHHLIYERGKGIVVSALSAVCQDLEGISVLDENGEVLPCAVEILDLIAQANVVLCLGHLSVEEDKAMVPLARQRGVKKILLSHPNSPFTPISVEDQKWFVAQGAIIERCVVDVAHGDVTWATLAADIRETGVDNNIISTDLGQPKNPSPVSGIKLAYDNMIVSGFSESDLTKMMSLTPMSLLDLS